MTLFIIQKKRSSLPLFRNLTGGGVGPGHYQFDHLIRADVLDAVGRVEKIFKDEWPEDRSSKRAVPRRMKQVERGQIMPEVTLDLHGLSVESATEKLTYFLQDAVYQGFQTVLIVTGKGLHSSDGPVLRQAMETLLNELREQVVEWGVAPKRYGGSGALVVFLRKLV